MASGENRRSIRSPILDQVCQLAICDGSVLPKRRGFGLRFRRFGNAHPWFGFRNARLPLCLRPCCRSTGPSATPLPPTGRTSAKCKHVSRNTTRLWASSFSWRALTVIMSNAMPFVTFRAAADPSRGAASPTKNVICIARLTRRSAGAVETPADRPLRRSLGVMFSQATVFLPVPRRGDPQTARRRKLL